MYGSGPEESAELYDGGSGDIKLRLEPIPSSEIVSRKGAVRFDLPRDSNNSAILGDGRNDENVIISQFHVVTLCFHNAVVNHLR